MRATVHTHTLKSGAIRHKVFWREGGKQLTRTFTDPESAERYRRLVQRVGGVEADRITDALDGASDVPTLAEAATHHVDYLTGVEPGTITRYRA